MQIKKNQLFPLFNLAELGDGVKASIACRDALNGLNTLPMELEFQSQKKNLPDVAEETQVELFAPLDWVGMNAIEVPVLIRDRNNQEFRIPAKAEAKVSLDQGNHRGIHMSRLYLLIQDSLAKTTLTPNLLVELSTDFLNTHKGLSSSSRIGLQFELPIERPALKSTNKAWRTYPVSILVENINGVVTCELGAQITYSSTCPASAALSRQLIQENFRANFSGEELNFSDIHQWLGGTQGILATPHAQRSTATLKIKIDPNNQYTWTDLIDLVEHVLQTPVQGAVKREDEQEFALRNGQNLMFCEDAARRVKSVLDSQSAIVDYWAEFSHFESLHPHNAVSVIQKR